MSPPKHLSRPRRSAGRLLLPALAVAALVHATLLVFVRVAPDPPTAGGGPLIVIPRAAEVPERLWPRPARLDSPESRPVGAAPAEPGTSPEPATPPEPRVPVPTVSPVAPLERTIPPTALRGMRAAVLPLVVTPGGIGRRTVVPDPRRIAIMRAESLLNARLATLPGTQREPSRTVGLANGGVTFAIPWAGFLPADRQDGRWRENRCDGKDAGAADKPGEAEARRSQCG
ncbi:MAG TPA: hypothetical protein VM737_12215 [Gemmatimonadota bacterium]|nr:hypothetical protein [Gemmatimonadota bacterium]